MAVTNRLRSVPPSLHTDEALLELPRDIRLTASGLRHYTDDHGRASARPALIRSALYPLDTDMTDQEIEWHLTVLDDVGYLRVYAVDDRQYLQVLEWPSQDRAQPSRVPPPPEPSSATQATTTAPGGPSAPREALATSSRAAREPVAVGEEREKSEEGVSGESGAGGESEAARARALLVGKPEPSPFCKTHTPTAGTDKKCIPCGRARLAHGQWTKAQMEAADFELGGAA